MLVNRAILSCVWKKTIFAKHGSYCQLQEVRCSSHVPRRALLFVPGDSERKIEKAATLKADVITFDCEDGVAISKKDDARKLIRKTLDTGKYIANPKAEKRSSEYSVRINSVDTPLCEEDLRTICSGPFPPSTIILPKIETVEQISQFANLLHTHLTKDKKINLIMYAENAIGMLNLPEVLKCATNLSQKCRFEPVALIFGSDDYCASIGASRTDSAIEVLYVRQKVVMLAKAFNLQAIDMVYINLKDIEGLRKQCLEGARMGYTGKQIIHPDQIAVAHETFLPSPAKVLWAQELIKAFDEHQAKGTGAFVHKGVMIDMPTIRQAQNIIDLVKSVQS